MKRKLVLVASAVLTTATAASLIFAGATSASARPVTPKSPSKSSLSFVVPANPDHPDQPLNAQGDANLWFLPQDDVSAYKVSITCDDGLAIPVTMRWETQNGRHASYGASFPVVEQGRVCTLHGLAPANRELAFSTPRLDRILTSTGPGGEYVPYLSIDSYSHFVNDLPYDDPNAP